MTEVDALLKIASAIESLAIVMSGIGTVFWLALFFKSMSSDSAIRRLTDVIENKLPIQKKDK